MDQEYYPMDPNAQNMYKKERRIQKKRIGYSQDPHICPVHGNKYGQNSQYVETRKEIRRFKVLTQIKKLEAGKAFVKRAS